MAVCPLGNYRYEKTFSTSEPYHLKITSELWNELQKQNLQDVSLDIENNSGTLTLTYSQSQQKKIFDISISPITQGEKESFELNMFKSNNRVESIGQLQVRLNVQATSKSYDMTKQKISEVEHETRRHCAKEIKQNIPNNCKGIAVQVLQRQKEMKNLDKASNNNGFLLNSKLNSEKFSIRQILLHILALQALGRDAVYLKLNRLIKMSSNDRRDADQQLKQISILNDDKYELNRKYYNELLDDWPLYSDNERHYVRQLKKANNNYNNDANLKKEQTTNKSHLMASELDDDTQRRSAPKSFSTETKIKVLNMLQRGSTISELSKEMNIPENLITTWKSTEAKLRKQDEYSKRSLTSNLSVPENQAPVISPSNSNSSSKTHVSQDEGFISGGGGGCRNSPPPSRSNNHHINSNHNTNINGKRHLPPGFLETTTNKKSKMSDDSKFVSNDMQSSSSCEVTPNSDVSPERSNSKSIPPVQSGQRISPPPNISEDQQIAETQKKFNIAFEQYSKLCSILTTHECKIESLRSKCNEKNADYSKLYASARSLLTEFNSIEFQSLTTKVKQLESEMSDYVRILTKQKC